MTPKYRFSEFSDEICPKSLSSYLIVNPDRNKDLTYSKDDVLSVSGELGVVNQIELLGRSYAGESVAEYHIVGNNDIVYTKSPLKANPYGIVKCNKGKTGIVSTLYAVYHCKGNTNPHFVDYYFAYDNRLNRYLKPLVRIGAKHDMKIGNEEVLVGTVGFPSLYEQQKIADFLTAYDEKVSLQQQKVDALEKRKKGLLQKVFSQEIRFKADDGSEFQEWEEKCFADFSVQTGKRNKDKIRYDIYAITNKNGFISQAEAHDEFAYMKDADISAYNIVSPYSFGYNPARINVGSIGYYEGENNVLVSSLYEIFQTNEQIIARFLLYWFKTSIFQKWVEKLQEGSVRLYFYYDKLCECRIAIPCLEEQQKIADFFSAIDEQIGLEKQRLEAMQTVKKGLLQQMFCDGSEAEEEEHTGAAAIYQLHPQASTLQAAQPDVEYNRSGQ